MECRIYKYDKDYRVNKEMEGIEFYIKLENKQQFVDFLVIFLFKFRKDNKNRFRRSRHF